MAASRKLFFRRETHDRAEHNKIFQVLCNFLDLKGLKRDFTKLKDYSLRKTD